MKRITVCLLVLIAFTFYAQAQTQEVNTFLKNFSSFVDSVAVRDSLTQEQYDSIGYHFDTYNRQYKDIYKAAMNDDQLSQYSEKRAKYDKSMAGHQANIVSDKIGDAANTVGKSIKKTNAKVSGYVKGIFKNDDKGQ